MMSMSTKVLTSENRLLTIVDTQDKALFRIRYCQFTHHTCKGYENLFSNENSRVIKTSIIGRQKTLGKISNVIPTEVCQYGLK